MGAALNRLTVLLLYIRFRALRLLDMSLPEREAPWRDKSCGAGADVDRSNAKVYWKLSKALLRAGVAEQLGGGLQTRSKKAALHGCKMRLRKAVHATPIPGFIRRAF